MTGRVRAIAVLVAVLIFAALFAAPMLIDAERHRGDLATRLSELLGREAVIEGKLAFSLLPAPSLEARSVRLLDPGKSPARDAARIERLQLGLRLAPLLAGRIEIANVTATRAEIALDRTEDGAFGWRLPSRGFDGIGLISLRDSSFTVHRVRQSPFVIRGLEASIAGGRFERTLHVRAAGDAHGVPMELDFSANRATADGAVPVELAVSIGERLATLRFSGTASGEGAAAAFTGKMNLRLRETVTPMLRARHIPFPETVVTVEGAVSANPRTATFSGLALDLSGARFTGAGSMTLVGEPQLDLKLASRRIDLAPWLDATADRSSSRAENQPITFALPDWLSVALDLTAESAVWRGAQFTDGKVDLALSNGELTVNEAGITLPGESRITLFGFIDAIDGAPSFEGSVEGGSSNPRGLVTWLGFDPGALPADRLQNARLSGALKWKPGTLSVGNAELRLDGSVINTALELRLGDRPGERLGLGASFVADFLNLDAYLPDGASGLSAALANVWPKIGALSSMFPANLRGQIGQVKVGGLVLGQVGLDLSWSAGSLILRDLSTQDLAGAQLAFSGQVALQSDKPLTVSALHGEMRAPRPERILRLLGLPQNYDPARLGPVALSVMLDGGIESVAVDSRFEAGGGQISLRGKVDSPLLAPKFDLDLAASHSSLAGFAALIEPAYRPAGDGAFAISSRVTGDPGRLGFSDLRVRAGPVLAAGQASFAISDRPKLEIALEAGDIPVETFLSSRVAAAPGLRALLAAVAPRPGRSFTITPVEPIAAQPRPQVLVVPLMQTPLSQAKIALDWLGTIDAALALRASSITWGKFHFDAPVLALDLADGRVSLDRFDAALLGGKFAASGALDSQGKIALRARLQDARVKQLPFGFAELGLADGALSAEADLNSSGSSIAEMAAHLNGAAKLEVGDGIVTGFDLAAADGRLAHPAPATIVSLVAAGLSGGETQFKRLGGTLRAVNGVISADGLKLDAAGGSAVASGAVNLPAWSLDGKIEFRLSHAPGAPPLALRLQGPLDQPKRTLDVNPMQNWLVKNAPARAKVKG